MSEVHRYQVVQMFTEDGNKIDYSPVGPRVVMASMFDLIKADLDAQRLRADTAEAENKLLRHQLAASAQELRKVSSWICREVEAGTTSATHWAIRLNASADQIDAALNPKPEAESHDA